MQGKSLCCRLKGLLETLAHRKKGMIDRAEWLEIDTAVRQETRLWFDGLVGCEPRMAALQNKVTDVQRNLPYVRLGAPRLLPRHLHIVTSPRSCSIGAEYRGCILLQLH